MAVEAGIELADLDAIFIELIILLSASNFVCKLIRKIENVYEHSEKFLGVEEQVQKWKE